MGPSAIALTANATLTLTPPTSSSPARLSLTRTELAQATSGSIRLKLLKIDVLRARLDEARVWIIDLTRAVKLDILYSKCKNE